MKELAQAHAEKLVLALCLVIMLYFLWSAFSMTTYDKDPSAFEKIERTASQNVANSKASLENLKASDFNIVVEKLQKAPDTTPLEFGQKWRRPFDFGLSFRNQPQILRPNKPVVQLNRAPLRLFKTDLNGKRIVRKVRGGEARNVARPLAGGGENRPTINPGDIEKIRALGFEPDEAAFYGNEHIFSILGLQQVDQPAVEPQPVGNAAPPVGNRQPIRSRSGEGAPKSAELKDNKTAPAKADAVVEEFVLAVVGREWVEVVASFPHAEQIKEYVKALRERADFVGLRYSRVEVQRQELDANMEWYPPEWQSVPLKEQWEVIQNAFGWEADPFAGVTLKGLAMHIPSMYTAERPFLSTPELDHPTPPEFAPEELDPAAAQKEKPKRTRKAPAGAAKGKKEFKARFVPPPPVAGADGAKAVFDNGYMLKNAMIRFWDFTVVPGKRYRYRVRVNVINPNFDRADVADRQFAMDKYLVGEWSEPSDEIYIEPNVLWFVGEKQSNRPDRVTLEVQSWSREIGDWIINEFIQRPGDVIGVKASQPPVAVLRWNEKTQKFDASNETLPKAFDTNQILLDVTGGTVRESVPGGSSPKQFKLPREVVSVNVYGDLIRRSEDIDKNDESRQLHKQRYQEMANEAVPGRGGVPKSSPAAGANDGAIDPLNQ
ncbi:MAG: hypothetical protein U1D30_02680 [Planctomycetota bacterium]